MTPKQIELIRASWTSVEPIQDVAATLFYDRLFELDPTLRRLFRRTDMAQQRKILMQTCTVVVQEPRPARPARPGDRGPRAAACRVRRPRSALRHGRSRAAVDARAGPRRRVHARRPRRLGRGLHRTRHGHDRRRPRGGRRRLTTPVGRALGFTRPTMDSQFGRALGSPGRSGFSGRSRPRQNVNALNRSPISPDRRAAVPAGRRSGPAAS